MKAVGKIVSVNHKYKSITIILDEEYDSHDWYIFPEKIEIKKINPKN